MQQSNLFFL